jgi:hypothetical protein
MGLIPRRYTDNDLGQALVDTIKVWTADMQFLSSRDPLPGEQRAYVQPAVWRGKIPQKAAGFQSKHLAPNYPCVIVRPHKTVFHMREYGVCDVEIACVCWSDDPFDGAETDTRELMERITFGIQTTVGIQPGFIWHDETSLERGLVDDPESEMGPISVGIINVAFGMPAAEPGGNEPPYTETGSVDVNDDE